MSKSIQLIAGLGNPGAEYAHTRHNAGFWLVDELARRQRVDLKVQSRFYGEVGRGQCHGHECWLLKPNTYMNRSGQSVVALANYFRIAPAEILVVHDDLDLAPGIARLKQGGGHGGHNGLRDIAAHIGAEFARLRLGIGHPGSKDKVIDSVLSRPAADDHNAILAAIDAALEVLPLIMDGDFSKAMNMLHRRQPFGANVSS